MVGEVRAEEVSARDDTEIHVSDRSDLERLNIGLKDHHPGIVLIDLDDIDTSLRKLSSPDQGVDE
ncbi:MAG: hypothetical protein ACI9OJ_001348 [Myxococcota bacterium]|jgi:hypothetical protein